MTRTAPVADSAFVSRVGAVRPSHLMFTGGVGSLVDLPNFSVLVKGLDDWNHREVPSTPIAEPRLLKAVQSALGRSVQAMKAPPWLEGLDVDPNGPAARVGVPVTPFPSWFRCTACNDLGPLSSRGFQFLNASPRRPHEAKFVHGRCAGARRGGRPPLAVAARFVLTCVGGHLDEFPYVHFVHRGGTCDQVSHPQLKMEDRGGNLGANVEIQCPHCKARRNMREAQGRRGEENLPRCRGRHPHIAEFDVKGCDRSPKLLVAGASNQWFARTLSALAVPQGGASALDAKVHTYWEHLEPLHRVPMRWARDNVLVVQTEFSEWTDEELADAMDRRRARPAPGPGSGPGEGAARSDTDLLTPEWEVFSADRLPDPQPDFVLRRDVDGVPGPLTGVLADVVQAERLREVRALIGFSRLDAPDPEDPRMVELVRLVRSAPTWVPASEVRGEGIFLRLPADLLADWEKRVADRAASHRHREAYARYRRNRYSDRISTPHQFDAMRHWPGLRYVVLHTLSHLMIRTIALECGYSSASLSERIYAPTADDPDRAGILIYTAVPDADGTLGGLVSLAEPDRLVPLVRRALRDALHCSSDPLCAERLPHSHADFLHGAACHVCLFVSETTCERGNRFLDRRFLVPLDDADLALYRDVP